MPLNNLELFDIALDRSEIMKKYFYKSDLVKNDCACADENFRFAKGCVDPNLKIDQEDGESRRRREL